MNKAELQAAYLEKFGEAAPTSWTNAKLTKELEGKNIDLESETEEVAPKPKGKQKAKGLYWKNPTHFMKFGTVTGLVTAEQEEEWNRVTPEGCDIMPHTLDYDPIMKRKLEAAAKAKAKAGLN